MVSFAGEDYIASGKLPVDVSGGCVEMASLVWRQLASTRQGLRSDTFSFLIPSGPPSHPHPFTPSSLSPSYPSTPLIPLTLATFFPWPAFNAVYQYFDKQVEDVILERPGELDCFSRNLTFSMPKPKFNEFTYVGQSVLNYQHANHWVISDHSGRHVVQYWDNVESGEPMQVCLRWCLRCVCAPAVCARAGGLCVCVFVCVCVCVSTE